MCLEVWDVLLVQTIYCQLFAQENATNLFRNSLNEIWKTTNIFVNVRNQVVLDFANKFALILFTNGACILIRPKSQLKPIFRSSIK